MNSTVLSILVAGLLIGGAIYLSSGPAPTNANVTTENGKQIVTIDAKGKYLPRATLAKADVPTVLRVRTNGTFDCTSALTIPSLNYQKDLPPTGITEIELPPQKADSSLKGRCAMGMYNFTVKFN